MRISVVTSTRNRPEHIGRAVRAVLESTHPDFDYTIVDQSADERTRQAVVAAAAGDRRVRYFHRAEPGKSKAMNFGILQGNGPIVAFTDDDCEPRPDWLTTVARTFHEESVDIICGKVSCAPHDPTQGYILGFDPVRPRVLAGPWTRIRHFGIGANLSVRREVLERLGYLDEMIGPGGAIPSGDDTDLLYRAARAGYRILLSPEPEVVHYGYRSWGKESHKHGRGLCTSHAVPYVKYMRRRDPAAFYAYARDILEQIHYAGARALRRQRPTGANRLKYMLAGLRVGAQFPLDPETMRFRPPE
ncbi:MAG: glycosyltransferase family 2 protein [Armatimonadetes bacterium]|nr:glycosyltransferase family 2 protein [Armatimonadota bacterium]